MYLNRFSNRNFALSQNLLPQKYLEKIAFSTENQWPNYGIDQNNNIYKLNGNFECLNLDQTCAKNRTFYRKYKKVRSAYNKLHYSRSWTIHKKPNYSQKNPYKTQFNPN